MDETNCLLIC